MAAETERSIGTSLTHDMTAEQFENLLQSDVNAWLKSFLSNFKFADTTDAWFCEEEERPTCMDIEWVYDYEDFDKQQEILGLHIKHRATVGGDYDGQEIEKIFAVKKGNTTLTNFAVVGFYNSYEYSEYDGEATEVEYKEVKVMQWVNKGA